MQRNPRIQSDDLFFGKAQGAYSGKQFVAPSAKNDRILIVPQDVSGDGAVVPLWLGALIVAGVLGIGYLVLKQEKIL